MKRLLIILFMFPFVGMGQLVNIEANDCLEAIPICSNESYSTTLPGTSGSVCDITVLNAGCIGNSSDPCQTEYGSTFFYFQIDQPGNLEWLAFNSGYDNDWVLYGPFNTNSLTSICTQMATMPPIRCNWCAVVGQPTGMVGNGGNGPCPPKSPNLAVQAGEVYLLVLMQWAFPPSPLGFDLVFNGGSGGNQVNSTATFDCSLLKVEYSSYYALSTPTGIKVQWKTLVEDGTSYFELLRADSSMVFETIYMTTAKGSNSTYTFLDKVSAGKYYYKIIEHDVEGNTTKSEIFLSNHIYDTERRLIKIFDLLGNIVDVPVSNTILLYQYDDGTIVKRIAK